MQLSSSTAHVRPYRRAYLILIFQCLDVWADVKELRDHNQERYDFNPEAWEEHEVNVGIFLTKVLKLKVRSYNRFDINSLCIIIPSVFLYLTRKYILIHRTAQSKIYIIQ